jgi:MFS family permease
MIDTLRTGLRKLEERPVTRGNRRGALIALLTCPCHGAAILFLLSGTALGGVLAAYSGWLYGALTAAFLAGLWLLFRRDPAACDRCV